MTKNDEILIIYTSWYTDFINEMTDAALERLESEDCMIKSFKAPGSLEIPALAKAKITSKTKGILAVGIVIRGETSHYDYVCGESARALMDLTTEFSLALGFGILTCENIKQARIRANINNKNKGGEAADACLRMIEVKRHFRID